MWITSQSVVDFGYNAGELDNIERVLQEFKNKADLAGVDNEKKESVIVALEKLMAENKPSTGDNSVLYLIISAAALAAMSAVVGQRKRSGKEYTN